MNKTYKSLIIFIFFTLTLVINTFAESSDENKEVEVFSSLEDYNVQLISENDLEKNGYIVFDKIEDFKEFLRYINNPIKIELEQDEDKLNNEYSLRINNSVSPASATQHDTYYDSKKFITYRVIHTADIYYKKAYNKYGNPYSKVESINNENLRFSGVHTGLALKNVTCGHKILERGASLSASATIEVVAVVEGIPVGWSTPINFYGTWGTGGASGRI